MERRLTTILVGDFVGSTSQMETDEEAALVRVTQALRLVTEFVEQNGGRVFNTAGDAVLAEFPSPVGGLRAVTEARMSLASAQGLEAGDMRFGLHVADVVSVGGDLRGDGVNIAARIQEDAAPGDINVSGVLYDHVRRVSPCTFEDLGERQLKGLIDPVRVLRVRGLMDRHVFQSAPTVKHPRPALRPNSIAVQSFRTTASADDEQAFLAEGLTEDIIHELSRFKSLFVSSRTASQSLEAEDPVEIGKALGVRYVLSGSVRRLGSRVRLSVALSEAREGEVVWSDRIQRPFEDVMDAMDEITAKVAATVSGRIDQAEIRAARMKRPENMTAYEHYLRGLEQHRLGGVSDAHAREAMRWFQRSRVADPNFARPAAMEVCAWSYLPDFDLSAADKMLAVALELDPSDPELHRILGIMQIKLYEDFETSRVHHETALRLAPNDAYILGRCAAFYTFAGEPERALDLLDKAEALDPFLPVWIIEERVAALYAQDRFEEMSLEARKLPFQTRRSRFYRAAARIARGDDARARELVAEALADDSDLTTQYIVSQELIRDTRFMETLLERLRGAGLPDPDTGAPLRLVAPAETAGLHRA